MKTFILLLIIATASMRAGSAFNGSTQYMRTASGTGITTPCSISLWIKTSSSGQTAGVITELTAVGPGYAILLIGGKAYASSQADAVSTNSYATGQWVHILAVFPSVSSRSVYLDSTKTTNTGTGSASSGAAVTDIGRYGNGTSYYTGQIAEVACWNVALSDADAAQLSAGLSARKVRPANLVEYWPIVGGGNQSGVRGRLFTNTGATNSEDHPRIYR